MQAPPTGADALPERFGKFMLQRRIGSGGMAEIFLAKALGPWGFDKPVVVKRILSHLCENHEFVEMFLSEAKIAARLHHPNIAQVYDFGRVAGRYFISMEYLDGLNLVQLAQRSIKRQRRLPISNMVLVIADVARGLHHAHEAKDGAGRPLELIHRDVTLSNVMISRDGTTKLLDFGVATSSVQVHETRAGAIKGKEGYLSPEQCEGQVLDRRSDIFSLGVVLYEITTGTRLFRGASWANTIRRITGGQIPPPRSVWPDYPPALEQIVLRMLALRREERFETARDVHVALEAFLEHSGERVLSPELGRLISSFCDDDTAAGSDSDGSQTSRRLPSPGMADGSSSSTDDEEDFDQEAFVFPDVKSVTGKTLGLRPSNSLPSRQQTAAAFPYAALALLGLVLIGSILMWTLIALD